MADLPTPMYDFFEKHGKKTLAVLGSLLILVFLMPSTMGRGGNVARQFGKVGGVEISGDDVAATQAALQNISRLGVQAPPQQAMLGASIMSLPQAVFSSEQFGPSFMSRIQQNPLLWNLLVRETNTAGVMADEQQIDSILSSPQVMLSDPAAPKPVTMKEINPDLREQFKPGLRAVLAVRKYFDRRREAIKFTKPMIDDALARQNQQVKAHLAVFTASAFESQITPATDDESRAQFDSYAADMPGAPTTRNPFGFGYRVSDKLTLQWITVPGDEVSRVIEAAKPAEIWDEDAIIFYQKNPQQFQTKPTATPPAVAPAPTTRPFAEAKADVLKKMRQPLVEQQQRKIASRIVQQMSLDAQRAREKNPTTQQAADSGTAYGVPLASAEYLQKLADDIQKQFGVKVAVWNQGGPVSLAQLNAVAAIGSSTLDAPDAALGGEDSGAAYLFNNCKPLAADAMRLGTFDVLQPSKALRNGELLVVARAIAAEASHPARSLDEARTSVEQDVKTKKSFAKAAEAAQKFTDAAAAAGGFDKAVLDKASGQNVLTTDWLNADGFDLAGVKELSYGYQLLTPIFDQLRGLTSPTELPRRAVIKRQSDRAAVAVEVFALQTKLNTATLAEQRMAAMQVAMRGVYSQAIDQKLLDEWFSLDGVSRRIGYVPDTTPGANGPGDGTPAKGAPPANPFVPG